MKSFPVFALLFLVMRAWAIQPLSADVVMDMENMTNGLIDTRSWSNGVHGSHMGLGWYDGSTSSTISPRHYCTNNTFTNWIPIRVGGTTYGQGTNCLLMQSQTQTNIGNSELRLFIGNPFNSTFPVGNALVFGLVQYSTTNNPQVNEDTFLMNNAGIDYCVMQSRPSLTDVQIFAHTDSGQFGAIILQQGHVYLFECLRDYTNSLWTVRYRDAATLAMVGQPPSVPIPSVQPTWGLHFKSGYLYDVDGTVVFDNVGVRFGATNFLSNSELGLPDPPSCSFTSLTAGQIIVR